MFPALSRKGVFVPSIRSTTAFFFEASSRQVEAHSTLWAFHALSEVTCSGPHVAPKRSPWRCGQAGSEAPGITTHSSAIEDYNDEWNQPGDYGTFTPTEFLPIRARSHSRGAASNCVMNSKVHPDLIIVDESHEYKRQGPGGAGSLEEWCAIEKASSRG